MGYETALKITFAIAIFFGWINIKNQIEKKQYGDAVQTGFLICFSLLCLYR